jgi:hypothetical protein
MRSFVTLWPEAAFIAAVRVPGNAEALEKRVHAYFTAARVGRSEVFTATPELLKWIDHFKSCPNVATQLKDVPDSYSTADLWPWYRHRLPMLQLEDERGQGLMVNPVRDYRQPEGHGGGQTSSMTEDWYTHPSVIEAVRELFAGEIDLDPFSCQEANRTVRATRFYTAEVDGLLHTWHGRLLINPPWGGSGNTAVKKRAIEKLLRSYSMGDVEEAVLVLNANATTTKWFAPLWQFPVCFPPYRIPHYGPGDAGGSPNSGTVLIYVGPQVLLFAEIFKRFGTIVQRIEIASDAAMDVGDDGVTDDE